jgi:hypothetical protein
MSSGRASSDSFIPQRHFGRVRGRSLREHPRPAADETSTATIFDGPGSLTLAERFIAAFRLPYALGCLVVGFVLFGILNTLFSKYVETMDLRQAVDAAFSPQNLATGLLFAYSFYAPRYMRTKLLDAGRSLPALMPDKEEGFRKTFHGVASVRPQVGTWIAFLSALLLAFEVAVVFGGSSSFRFDTSGSFSWLEFLATIVGVVSLAVVSLALSSVVWTYWSISAGMRRFSGTPLELRPYYEDPFLGLKPVGSLALSLATVYFGFIALFLLALLTSPSTPKVGDLVGVGGFLFGLIVLGVLLFFLPLTKLHRRMVAEQRTARAVLNPQMRMLFQESPGRGHDDVGHVLRVDLMDRKVAAIAGWPYDVGILGRLSVIAVSVTAILISRLLALVFHI